MLNGLEIEDKKLNKRLHECLCQIFELEYEIDWEINKSDQELFLQFLNSQ